MGAADPQEWADDKLLKLRRYAVGDVARYVRAARDVALPGVPVAALLGVAVNGGSNENTTGWRSCSPAERERAIADGRKPLGGKPGEGYGRVGGNDLHELGPFGVEAGHVPDLVAGSGTPWHELASSEVVRKILGRDAVTGSDWYGALEDQCAVGVACIRRHAIAMNAKLRGIDPRLAWTADGDDGAPKVWTPWSFWPGVAAWSAGEGGLARHLTRYASTLVATPEADRLAAFVRCASGYDDGGAKHVRPSYTALRTLQKMAGGRLAVPLIADEPWAAQWMDDGLGADRPQVLAALVRSARG